MMKDATRQSSPGADRGTAWDHLDVQCVLMVQGTAQQLFRSAHEALRERGWTLEAFAATDLSSAPLPADAAWPPETLGSMTYRRDTGDERALFWSTHTAGGLSRISFGLYIHQYGAEDRAFDPACDRALEELRALFGSEATLCIVLSLEDGAGIDLAPGLVGYYRPSLWQRIAREDRTCLASRTTLEGWVEVRPVGTRAEPSSSLDSLRALQKRLEEELRGP